MNSPSYMTCAELADRLRVSERTIREDWKDSILIEDGPDNPVDAPRLYFLYSSYSL